MKFPVKNKMFKRISGFFAGVALSALAALSVSAYGYNSNMLTNGTPTSESGWSVSGGYYQKGDYDGEFKADEGKGPVTATQTVTLTARDRIRANNGELTVKGSAYFWAQASCTMTSQIRIIALDANGNEVAIFDYVQISTVGVVADDGKKEDKKENTVIGATTEEPAEDTGMNPIVLIAIIAGGVLLVAAAVIVVIILSKKRKAKKA